MWSKVATAGSITAASQRAFFIAQPSLSRPSLELESEMASPSSSAPARASCPRRTAHAVPLVRAAAGGRASGDLEAQYKHGTPRAASLASQASTTPLWSTLPSWCVSTARAATSSACAREPPLGTIEDVRLQRSELVVLYRNDFNREVLTSAIRDAELRLSRSSRPRARLCEQDKTHWPRATP